MRTSSLLLAAMLALGGCESVPEQTAQPEEHQGRCDTMITGSRIPQCNRGDVRVQTRDELERSGFFSSERTPPPPSN